MTFTRFEVPQQFRRGGKKGNQEAHVATALDLIGLLCRVAGRTDLSDVALLDMGCGTKLVQAFLDYQLPVGRYVGVDVYREMIDFLNREVDDPRFSFFHIDSHNEMYNPGGAPLSAETGLPCPDDQFDLICLFSVFTHLAPHDYVEMLKLLRPYIKPGGKLIFSLFLNETTPEGNAFADGFHRDLRAMGITAPPPDELDVPDFLDFDPGQPLKWALYSRPHAIALVEGTGWTIDSVNYPEESIQHYMICSPG